MSSPGSCQHSSRAYVRGESSLPSIHFFRPSEAGRRPLGSSIPSLQDSNRGQKSAAAKTHGQNWLSNTAQLALARLQYIIAGAIAGDWAKSGRLGAVITNLVHLLGLSVARNVETAARFERAQVAACAHLARRRGDLQLIKDEFVEAGWGRSAQCFLDQVTEFTYRKESIDGCTSQPPRSHNQPLKRPESS